MPDILLTYRQIIFAGSLVLCCLWPLSALAAVTSNDHSLFDQAVQLSQQGQWQKAASLFSDIAKRNPDWPEPKNNIAVVMIKLGRVNEAQQALEAAVTSQPSFETAQSNRKKLYDYLAAAAYEKAIGNSGSRRLPQLDLLTSIQQPVSPVQAEPEPAPTPVKPVAALVGPTDAQADIAATIKKGLQTWSRAWSIGDVDTYLNAYSSRFKPDQPGTDYNQWRNIRRARLTLSNNTQVVLQDVHIYIDDARQQAIAEFIQHYRSDRYQDEVIKQLLLARQDGRWLILSEREIEKLN